MTLPDGRQGDPVLQLRFTYLRGCISLVRHSGPALKVIFFLIYTGAAFK